MRDRKEQTKEQKICQKIGVVGGGLMGHGIAYLFAAAGHQVGVFEPAADIRVSLPQRLRSIVELLGDDPVLLSRIEAHDALARRRCRAPHSSLKRRRRNCR
jgi:3-hydroxyacyl-CoA dehydrogenase